MDNTNLTMLCKLSDALAGLSDLVIAGEGQTNINLAQIGCLIMICSDRLNAVINEIG